MSTPVGGGVGAADAGAGKPGGADVGKLEAAGAGELGGGAGNVEDAGELEGASAGRPEAAGAAGSATGASAGGAV